MQRAAPGRAGAAGSARGTASVAPERALCRLDNLQALSQIHPRLTCLDQTWDLFAALRHEVASGRWDVDTEGIGRPTPGLYLALLTYRFAPGELEALAGYLKVYRTDLNLLRNVLHLREREADLDKEALTNREIDELLRYGTTSGLLILWLCAGPERVRDRVWRYEQELRHVQPTVDGQYLMSLGLKPSPLFGRLLKAVRDARLDGTIRTEDEEKALIAQLLAERDRG